MSKSLFHFLFHRPPPDESFLETTLRDQRSDTVPPPAPHVRLLTSWITWAILLGVCVIAGGFVVGQSVSRRAQAMEHLDQHGKYELTETNAWMTEWFGDAAKGFRRVESAIRINEPSDETLRHLSALSEVTELWSYTPRIEPIETDGVRALQSLVNLEEILLTGEGFTEQRLSELFAARPPLTHVRLVETGASRHTLAELSHFDSLTSLLLKSETLRDDEFVDTAPYLHLRELRLTGRLLGDQTAAWGAQSRELQALELWDTMVTDEGLRSLSTLPQLQSLRMTGGSITDEGLRHIARMHHLESLWLFDSPAVTAVGFAHLASLPHLRFMKLSVSALTPETVESLRLISTLTHLTPLGQVPDPELRAIIERDWQQDD